MTTMGWSPIQITGPFLQGPLTFAHAMIDAYVDGAKLFWSYWGPFAEPAIAMVESVAEMQRQALSLVAESIGGIADSGGSRAAR